MLKKLKDKKTAKKSAAAATASKNRAKMKSAVGTARKVAASANKANSAERRAKKEARLKNRAKSNASRSGASTDRSQKMAVAMYGKGPHMGDSSKLTGAGSEGTPGLGRMSMSPQPGMYGRGSKISYGNYSAPKMGSYAKHGGKGSPSMHKMPSFIKGKKK